MKASSGVVGSRKSYCSTCVSNGDQILCVLADLLDSGEPSLASKDASDDMDRLATGTGFRLRGLTGLTGFLLKLGAALGTA